MVMNADKYIDELKSQIEQENQEDKEVSPEELVEEAIEEPVEEPTEEIAEEVEEVIEESELDEEGYLKEKEGESNKDLRKRIQDNYREKIEERDNKIKEMEALVKEIQLKQAEQEGYQKALQQPEKDTDPEPDPVLDPEEHTNWKLRQIEKERVVEKQEMSLIKQQVEHQNTLRAIDTLEREYSKANPDIDLYAAEQFIREREAVIIKMQHPNATDEQIKQHFDDYKVMMYKNAALAGKSGAELVMDMAKNYGYESKKAPTKKPNISAIKKNQKKSASLIGGSDAVKEHTVSPQAIFEMSMEELINRGGSDFVEKTRKNLR